MSLFPPTGLLSTSEIVSRLLLALACGAVIGLNRDFHRKPAGFRTFGLVSMGSALAVMVMHDVSGGADAVSRVVQGVLTGIGFLGAGVILHRSSEGKTVVGLTTAAAVWLTAALGVAAGAGLARIAVSGLVLGMILLLTGRPLERLLERLFRRGHKRGPGPGAPPPTA